MSELQRQILALISSFAVCSLDAIHAQLAVRHGARAIAGALASLRLAGKIEVVEPRKYRAL